MVYAMSFVHAARVDDTDYIVAERRAKADADAARDSLPETASTMTIKRTPLVDYDSPIVGRGPLVDD